MPRAAQMVAVMSADVASCQIAQECSPEGASRSPAVKSRPERMFMGPDMALLNI